jgi:hypothetical protein
LEIREISQLREIRNFVALRTKGLALVHDLEKLRRRLALEVRAIRADLYRLPDQAQLADVELSLRDLIETTRRTRLKVQAARQTAPVSDPPVIDPPAAIGAPPSAAVPVMALPVEYQVLHQQHFHGE